MLVKICVPMATRKMDSKGVLNQLDLVSIPLDLKVPPASAVDYDNV